MNKSWNKLEEIIMGTSKLEDFKLAIWNPQTRTCLGRTGDSWAKLIAFYIVLYSCLATLWSIYFHLFHLTISDKYPKWQLEESLIGTNPGLGFRPQSPRHRVESALISYREGLDGDFKHWVDDLNEYLEPMDLSKQSSEAVAKLKKNCDTNDPESFCPFDNSTIPPECTAAQNFSFPLGQPCLLIKLNRIYGWKPEPYENKPSSFPPEAPFTPGNIAITCEGQHDADKEHIGPIDYFPNTGIETKYYPFLNQPGYQSPYVMVHFKKPMLNTLIYIECKAWAKNVEHDRYNKKGMTAFELYIEKSTSPERPKES